MGIMHSYFTSFYRNRLEGTIQLCHIVWEIQTKIKEQWEVCPFFFSYRSSYKVLFLHRDMSAPLCHLCVPPCFPFNYQKGELYWKNNDKVTTTNFRNRRQTGGEEADLNKVKMQQKQHEEFARSRLSEPPLHDTVINLDKIIISTRISCKEIAPLSSIKIKSFNFLAYGQTPKRAHQ